ncbi:SWIM zinc finger family protein [Streptomyces griseorubiginosus]|uniref:SWIM zinc finger family protein n=1 Tax=Streptomyces griseorubiginosus TaxID=67304 RepID=UPI0036AD34CA
MGPGRFVREGAESSAAERAYGPAAEGADDSAAEGAHTAATKAAASSAAEGTPGTAVKGSADFEERERTAGGGAAARASAEADEPGASARDGAGGAVAEDAVTGTARPEPRPGDAARAALREAVAARRSSIPGAEDGAGRSGVRAVGAPSSSSASEGAEQPPPPTEAAPDDTPRRPDARPGDAAREALRAARKRRADAEAAEAEAALARRSRRGTRTPTPSPDRTRAPRPAAGVRARDVRELLADAFRMPDDVNPPGERWESNSPSPEGSPVLDETPLKADTTRATSPTDPHPPTGTHPSPPPAEDSTHPGTTPGTPPGGATPRHPHSMAAPNRDSDLRRTFPAFPPHASDGARFAATWWGNAWVTALEEGALDAKRLARGRGYAEQGHVDAITVTPGLVLAYVRGSRPRPYRVQVRLRTLGDADWDRFLDLAADRTGHIAALLDREMPQSLAECGVPLLPGPGDLEPQCSCPDRGHPCKHAAALCYQTARLLDADPFVLLLLRGRGERELLDALSRLSAARAARAAQEKEPAPLPGVRASEALASRRLPPLPAPLPVPAHPEQPPAYPASPGGPDPFALDQLATDAAARAHALLGTGRDPVGELTLWQDAVRLAAARPGSGLTAGTRALYASLAAATDRTPADLARAVAAWRQGGLEGLAVLEEPWDPPAGRFDRARPLLLAADLPAFRPWRNHLTHPRGHVQLRLGRDGLWYAYESEPGHDDWWPRGTPDLDPVGALTGLGTPSDP